MSADAAILTRTLDPPPAPGHERTAYRFQYPDGRVGWLITGYAAGRKILADPRFGVRPLRCPFDDGGALSALSGPLGAGDILRLDGPEHLRLRRQLTRHFTAAAVSEHRAALERVVGECLDAMEAAGPPVDFVQSFALPMPSLVMCDFMGIPVDDRAQLEQVTAVWVDFEGTSVEEKIAAMQRLDGYARGLIEQKRRRPGEASGLLDDLIAEGGWTDDELVGVVFLLFAAGHHTTGTMLALSVHFLLSEPERWEQLDPDDHEAIEQLVEELLRYLNISSLLMTVRTAQENVELDDGSVIRAGDAVTVQSPVPSGDPDALSHPEQFEPSRSGNIHLAFGHGRHICLGQHLARLEMEVALVCLKRRFPTLRLAFPSTDAGEPAGRDRSGGGFDERHHERLSRESDILRQEMPVAW